MMCFLQRCADTHLDSTFYRMRRKSVYMSVYGRMGFSLGLGEKKYTVYILYTLLTHSVSYT